MSEPKPLEYAYSDANRTWDHSIVMPPITAALASIPAGGAVIDIGCGNGAMLAELRGLGAWKLCGTESSETAVTVARAQGLDVILTEPATELTDVFGPRSFDLVISVEVIEHVYDPTGLLRQARAILKPGGRILLTTPYHGYLKNLVIAVTGKCDSHYNPLWDCGHIKFWSRKTLTKALEQAGFSDVRFHGAGRLPWLWKSMVLTATAP